MPRGVPNQRDESGGPSTTNVDPDATPTPETGSSPETDEKAPKPETHAQRARKEADAAQAATEKAELDRAESFSVIFPTGISVFAGPDVHEVKVTVGGVEQWFDVENGWVRIPKGGLIRATSMAELADLRQKASFRFVESIANEAP